MSQVNSEQEDQGVSDFPDTSRMSLEEKIAYYNKHTDPMGMDSLKEAMEGLDWSPEKKAAHLLRCQLAEILGRQALPVTARVPSDMELYFRRKKPMSAEIIVNPDETVITDPVVLDLFNDVNSYLRGLITRGIDLYEEYVVGYIMRLKDNYVGTPLRESKALKNVRIQFFHRLQNLTAEQLDLFFDFYSNLFYPSINERDIQVYYETVFEEPPKSWALREATLKALKIVSEIFPDGVVLDLGCGPGKCTLAAAELFPMVHAVDMSSKALDILTSQANALGLQERIATYQGDIRYMEILNTITAQIKGEIALVIAYGLFEYFTYAEVELTIKNLMKVTKPGGIHYIVHLVTPYPDTPTLVSSFERNMKEPGFLPALYEINGWTVVCLEQSYKPNDNHALETTGQPELHDHNVERFIVVNAKTVPNKLFGLTMT